MMAYYTPHEEQTQCCYSEECNKVADNRVLVGHCFQSVCDDHKKELEEWIAEQFT